MRNVRGILKHEVAELCDQEWFDQLLADLNFTPLEMDKISVELEDTREKFKRRTTIL